MIQYQEEMWMIALLDALGVEVLTTAIACDDRVIDHNYKLLKENPDITKSEFLQKMKKPPRE
jgi:hypothetical protein